VTSYYTATGEKAWWARGLSWQPKTVPVIDGDMIHALAADIGNDSETQKEVPTYEQLVAAWDADHDGKVTVDELRANPKFKRNANQLDLDASGFIDECDWKSIVRAWRFGTPCSRFVTAGTAISRKATSCGA
jgi:hypothetical protein